MGGVENAVGALRELHRHANDAEGGGVVGGGSGGYGVAGRRVVKKVLARKKPAKVVSK